MNQSFKNRISKAVTEYANSRTKTEAQIAKESGISRQTLSRHVQKLGIDRKHPLYNTLPKNHNNYINKLHYYANEYIQQASLKDATNCIINGVYIIKERCKETSPEAYHQFIQIFGDGK